LEKIRNRYVASVQNSAESNIESDNFILLRFFGQDVRVEIE